MGTNGREPRPIGGGICEVALTHGKVAIIDESDDVLVSCTTWFAHMRKKNPEWYATGSPQSIGKQIRLHRFILGLMPGDKRQGDHINGDVSDNRRCNLRVVNNQENNRNRRTAVGCLGLKGVKKLGSRFRASITIDSEKKHLGTFPTAIEAALAYDAAAVIHFGDHAATNQSLGLLA